MLLLIHSVRVLKTLKSSSGVTGGISTIALNPVSGLAQMAASIALLYCKRSQGATPSASLSISLFSG